MPAAETVTVVGAYLPRTLHFEMLLDVSALLHRRHRATKLMQRTHVLRRHLARLRCRLLRRALRRLGRSKLLLQADTLLLLEREGALALRAQHGQRRLELQLQLRTKSGARTGYCGIIDRGMSRQGRRCTSPSRRALLPFSSCTSSSHRLSSAVRSECSIDAIRSKRRSRKLSVR